LRQATRIGDGEQVIMMIAVGTLPEEFEVAYSPRRGLEDVLQIH